MKTENIIIIILGVIIIGLVCGIIIVNYEKTANTNINSLNNTTNNLNATSNDTDTTIDTATSTSNSHSTHSSQSSSSSNRVSEANMRGGIINGHECEYYYTSDGELVITHDYGEV